MPKSEPTTEVQDQTSGIKMPDIDVDKKDATMLQKAKFDFDKDLDKLQKYGIVSPEYKVTRENAAEIIPTQTDPEVILEAAEKRAEEYDKELDGYIKELRIAAERFSKYSPRDMVNMNYNRYESYDLAVAAVEAKDPCLAIF